METHSQRDAHPHEAATHEPASPSHPSGPACEVPPAPDLLAFDPVPVRYRTDGWTPEKQREYVEALADTGVAKWAAARVGMTEQSANRLRRRADGRSFDLACAAAQQIGARRVVSLAFERAIEGTVKRHYYRGELVGEERVYDNRLLAALLPRLLAALEPTHATLTVEKNWQPFVDAIARGEQPAEAKRKPVEEFDGTECRQDEDGVWWTEFPPPEGFDGEEEGRWGDRAYRRTLTEEEAAVLRADEEEAHAAELAAARAARDRYFGFVPASEAIEVKSWTPALRRRTGCEPSELSPSRRRLGPQDRGAAEGRSKRSGSGSNVIASSTAATPPGWSGRSGSAVAFRHRVPPRLPALGRHATPALHQREPSDDSR